MFASFPLLQTSSCNVDSSSRYAPSAKDLASRDVVSRAMTIEIMEGRWVLLMYPKLKVKLETMQYK